MKVFILIGAIGFIYALIYYPRMVAVMLFTLGLADVNFDLPGMPLNLRAVVSIALFGRVLFDKSADIPSFFVSKYTKFLLFFIGYIALVSLANDLLDVSLGKEFFLSFLAAYLGYYFFWLEKDYFCLRLSLILAGLICVSDMAYTYVVFGEFPVQRIYNLVVPLPEQYFGINHNFFGYMCGMAFVFLLHDFLNQAKSTRFSLFALLMMFLGVLMSTSRGALMGMLVVGVVMVWKAVRSKENGKKVYNFITISIGCLILTLFLFQIMQTVLGINSDFLETISARLVEEPLAAINKMLGYKYNSQSGDSVEWREEASSFAYSVFSNLKPLEQLFGIGYGGFIKRSIRDDGLDAHNGILLLLIENGVAGFLIYFGFIFTIFKNVIKQKLASPTFAVVCFILLFAITHNKEMTGFAAFLIFGSLCAELDFFSRPRTISAVSNSLVVPMDGLSGN